MALVIFLLLRTLCETCSYIEFCSLDEIKGEIRHVLDEVYGHKSDRDSESLIFKDPLFYLHLPSLSALQISAQTPCHLCSLIAHGLGSSRGRPSGFRERVLDNVDQVYLYTYSDNHGWFDVGSKTMYARIYLNELQGTVIRYNLCKRQERLGWGVFCGTKSSEKSTVPIRFKLEWGDRSSRPIGTLSSS